MMYSVSVKRLFDLNMVVVSSNAMLLSTAHDGDGGHAEGLPAGRTSAAGGEPGECRAPGMHVQGTWLQQLLSDSTCFRSFRQRTHQVT